MKAAVCYEYGAPLSVEDVEIAAPQKGEVKVRVAVTAICHSDVHLIRGEWGGRPPTVAGHETAGIVEEVGEDVAQVHPGDRVIVSLLRACGRCFYCVTGLPNLCEGAFPLERGSRLRNQRGESLRHGFGTATFAEYAIVDQSQVVRLPDDIPLDRAALLACGVITGVGAAVNTAQVRPGTTVVVIGTGGVGLNAVQGARLAGATQIVAVDLLDAKLATARVFGATHTINAGSADAPRAVRDLTSGRGADYALVTVASAPAVEQGLAMLRPAGTLVIVGLPSRSATAAIPIFQLVAKGQHILGSNMGSTRLSVDVPWLVDLYRQGRLKLDELITARYPLDQINEAIAKMEAGEALRNVIMFEAGA
ncbi:MAG TPA: Zn-dependent alcohol dehydrogenase [Ktedonobacterales bacterium]|nr:Zn-dependent alcohol dehydrogenase [Ktedonobacterales bacterium]